MRKNNNKNNLGNNYIFYISNYKFIFKILFLKIEFK